jgi:hypothetical protein
VAKKPALKKTATKPVKASASKKPAVEQKAASPGISATA